MNELDSKKDQIKPLGRRDFLDRILAGWGTMVLVPFMYGLVRFLLPVRSSRSAAGRVIVGEVSDLSPHSAKIIRLNEKPVMLIKMRSGQVKALSARCTHLGCTVEFREEQEGYLFCNCHGSRFDMNGKNVSGPAPKPLQPYKVTLEDDQIAVTMV